MHRFWDTIIEPILTIIQPNTIIEIGSETGKNTKRILEYCTVNSSKLHSIDPFPKYNVEKWHQQYPDIFIPHISLSLSAIPLIDEFDVVLIDGDHNWYTVFNELKVIENQCEKQNQEFPLILFHDIGWPYGRRDLYYNPENIPELHRKPYAKKGIIPGISDLIANDGLNPHLNNAIYENDLHNGVLTAIEDFTKQTSISFTFTSVHGFNGLGILIPVHRCTHQLTEFITSITILPPLNSIVDKIEQERMLGIISTNKLKNEYSANNLEFEKVVTTAHSKNQKQQLIIKNQQVTIDNQQAKITAQQKRQKTFKSSTNKLNREIQEKNEQLIELHKCMKNINTHFSAILGSRRWKLGNGIGEILRRITLKKKPPMAFEKIQHLLKDNAPQKREEKKKTSPIDYKLLTQQCENIFSPSNVKHSLTILADNVPAIIIPIYDAYSETKNCIDSVLKHTSIPYELILINDCSPDLRIIELLKQYEEYSFIRCITNSRNIGFVKTVNLGISESSGDALLLNSDTIVTSRWLQKLMLAAYSAPQIATVTPFSNASGAFSVPEIGQNREIPANLTLSGMAHLVERTSKLTYPRVPTGNGFCLYIKRQVINEIGLFDDINFNRGYGEENDFCMRATKTGWQHIIDDSTFIYHKNGASFSNDKAKLIKENRKVLDQLHPNYTKLVKEFISSPLIKTIRHNIQAAMKKPLGNKRPDALRILYVMHEGTGGTPATNQDLMQHISREHDCFLLTSTTTHLIVRHISQDVTTQVFKHKLSHTWSAKNFNSDEFKSIYFSLLTNLQIEIVHIRHLFKHTFDLPYICRKLGLGVVFSFHDFYHVCPSIHLLDANNKFCNGRCNGNGQCRIPTTLLADLPQLNEWLPTWQKAIANIFEQCDVFITTTECTKTIYTNTYPILKNKRFRVIEHGRDFPSNWQKCYTIPRDQTKIKILIPGNIDVHKGSSFIKQLFEHDKENRIEFHFIGTVPKEMELLGLYHGPYKRADFNKIVSRISPSFIGIFSICPETYCHTLSEAWASSIPVLGFNIGAIGERLSKHQGGWFLDMENVPNSYKQILTLASNSAEYTSTINKIQKIRLKTTREMADEYLKEYFNSRLLTQKRANLIRSIALIVPQKNKKFPGSTHIRCILPLQHPDFSHHFSIKILSSEVNELYLDRNLKNGSINYLLVQRDALIGEALNTVLSWCQKNKVPLIYEIDDNLIDIDPSHAEYAIYKTKIKAVKKLCHSANVVTVSTPELLKNLKKYSTNIRVIKNSLDEHLWFSPLSHLKKNTIKNTITIGYMGTYTHENDLKLLDEVLPAVKSTLEQQHGITIKFYMIGGKKDMSKTETFYERICVPGSKSEYPRFVTWLRQHITWDIAIAPLADNRLNENKSELKFLEYTALGAAGIYSDQGGYSHAITHRKNGLLVHGNSIEKWKSYLIELALDNELRDKIVTHAKNTVTTKYLLKQRAQEWISVFNSL